MASKLSADTKNFIPSILIIAFLLVGFIPNIQAVDKVAPQWVYLTLVNILSAIYLFLNRDKFEKVINKVISTGISLFYIGFFVWASLSYFYSINNIEALVNIPRHLNTLLMYLFIGIFIYEIKEKNILISWFIAILLSIEVYAVFTQAIDMIATTGSI
jgi:surface polysaccharide O-acyltransferase-like enzyme